MWIIELFQCDGDDDSVFIGPFITEAVAQEYGEKYYDCCGGWDIIQLIPPVSN